MSRIGKLPVQIPSGVEVKVDGNIVKVKGPKGELTQAIENDGVKVSVENNVVTISRVNEEKQTRASHGLYRSLISIFIL